jgi:hypothetical protein
MKEKFSKQSEIRQDNYFSLLPVETRQITATYHTKSNAPISVEVEEWNVNHSLAQVVN